MQILNYLSDVAELIEKTGDVLKEYENLCCRVYGDIEYTQQRLDGDLEYIGPDAPKMPEEERAELQKFVDDAKALKGDLKKNVADLMKHNIVLTGLLCKYGSVRPTQDGLALAVNNIIQEGNE